MNGRHRIIAGLGLIAVACATPFVGAAEVIGARIGHHPDKTRLVLDLDARTSYDTRYLDGYRLEISLGADSPVTAAALAKARASGLISRMTPTATGLVLTLKGPARITQSFTLTAQGAGDAPYRIVLDLAPVSGDAWARLTGAGENRTPAARPTPMVDRLQQSTDSAAEAAPATMPQAEPQAGQQPDSPPVLAPVASDQRLFDGLSLDGYAEIEGRIFTTGSREPGPKNGALSFAIEPTLSQTWNNGRTLLSVTPFARIDSNDHDRSHWDIREAKLVAAMGRFELRAGIDKQFWGVVESQHLVDILNQDDALEDVDGEDKLGQLMAGVSYQSDFGRFSAYALSWFRERRFAGAEGRPRGPLPVAYDLTQYESGADKWHVDWALRWSHVMGPVDMAVSYFKGTARDPVLLLGRDGQGRAVLIPRYDLIDQAGLELQGTFGPLLLKAEAIHRSQPGENTTAAIAGFEYTLFNVWGSSDLGILGEYLWDSRRRPLDNPFDDDIFAALRWSANDIAGTTLLVGSIFDLSSRQKFVTIEASRRMGDGWRLALEGRLFLGVPASSPLYLYSDDDFLQLKLQRHF